MYTDHADMNVDFATAVKHPLFKILQLCRPVECCVWYPSKKDLTRYPGYFDRWTGGVVSDPLRHLVLQEGRASLWLQDLCREWDLQVLSLHNWRMYAMPAFRTQLLRIFDRMLAPTELTHLQRRHDLIGAFIALAYLPATMRPKTSELLNIGHPICFGPMVALLEQDVPAFVTISRQLSGPKLERMFQFSVASCREPKVCKCCGVVYGRDGPVHDKVDASWVIEMDPEVCSEVEAADSQNRSIRYKCPGDTGTEGACLTAQLNVDCFYAHGKVDARICDLDNGFKGWDAVIENRLTGSSSPYSSAAIGKILPPSLWS
jgi:hypothetical protein